MHNCLMGKNLSLFILEESHQAHVWSFPHSLDSLHWSFLNEGCRNRLSQIHSFISEWLNWWQDLGMQVAQVASEGPVWWSSLALMEADNMSLNKLLNLSGLIFLISKLKIVAKIKGENILKVPNSKPELFQCYFLPLFILSKSKWAGVEQLEKGSH